MEENRLVSCPQACLLRHICQTKRFFETSPFFVRLFLNFRSYWFHFFESTFCLHISLYLFQSSIDYFSIWIQMFQASLDYLRMHGSFSASKMKFFLHLLNVWPSVNFLSQPFLKIKIHIEYSDSCRRMHGRVALAEKL